METHGYHQLNEAKCPISLKAEGNFYQWNWKPASLISITQLDLITSAINIETKKNVFINIFSDLWSRNVLVILRLCGTRPKLSYISCWLNWKKIFHDWEWFSFSNLQTISNNLYNLVFVIQLLQDLFYQLARQYLFIFSVVSVTIFCVCNISWTQVHDYQAYNYSPGLYSFSLDIFTWFIALLSGIFSRDRFLARTKHWSNQDEM